MTKVNDQLIPVLNASMDLELAITLTYEELHRHLRGHIDHLIINDFHKLVFLLYRIDISEKKIRDMLARKEDTDTAGKLADMIIERELQKIKSRQQSPRPPADSDEFEKW